MATIDPEGNYVLDLGHYRGSIADTIEGATAVRQLGELFRVYSIGMRSTCVDGKFRVHVEQRVGAVVMRSGQAVADEWLDALLAALRSAGL